MPISGWDPINSVMNVIQTVQPKRVLDLGIGSGQWGFLIRNYLDLRYGRFDSTRWQIKIVGVEGFRGYRNPTWELYSEIVIDDIRNYVERHTNIVSKHFINYDAILMIEVLEHLHKEDGINLLYQLRQLGRHIVFSYANMDQGPVLGNDFEIHRSRWSDQEILEIFPNAVEIHKTSVGKFFHVAPKESK